LKPGHESRTLTPLQYMVGRVGCASPRLSKDRKAALMESPGDG
jgi:hypothetical protein